MKKKEIKKPVQTEKIKPEISEKQNQQTKPKKIRIKYKNIFIFLLIFSIISYIIYKVVTCNITNIYIKGNAILSDWEVIQIAKLDNYPKSLSNLSFTIEKRLTDDDMILSAKVSKKSLTKVYIEIEENRPLFYNSNINKVVMLDKKTLTRNDIVPYLVNYIPDTIYDKFITSMSKIDPKILLRISEIEYKTSDTEKERFYLTMNDGNYVYITIKNLEKINNYINMLKQFNNKKGILYLDSGEYFEIK